MKISTIETANKLIAKIESNNAQLFTIKTWIKGIEDGSIAPPNKDFQNGEFFNVDKDQFLLLLHSSFANKELEIQSLNSALDALTD